VVPTGYPNGIAGQPAAILCTGEPVTSRGIRYLLVEETRQHNEHLDGLREPALRKRPN
jgi:hypothetical protein